jgi:hypothetical protein
MEQQGISSQEMRNGKDQSGFKTDRQKQAYRGKARGNMAQKSAPNAGRQRRQMETANERAGDTALWQWRCPELGIAEWRRAIGPIDSVAMARRQAEFIDFDEARIMAFGGKKYLLELRRHNHPHILQFQIEGAPVYRYRAFRLDKRDINEKNACAH